MPASRLHAAQPFCNAMTCAPGLVPFFDYKEMAFKECMGFRRYACSTTYRAYG
jgi:hypothetical protein